MTRKQMLVSSPWFWLRSAQPRAQDNPQATSGSWRPTIVAQHGMVAAGHPLAAEAGMRILKAGRQRDGRGDRDLGGAGRSRARHDRPRRRHVRPLLQREDRRGEVHQRHRLRAAGGDDRLLQIEGRHPRRRPAVDRGAGRGRRRGLRGEEVRHQAARPRCSRRRSRSPTTASRSRKRWPAASRARRPRSRSSPRPRRSISETASRSRWATSSSNPDLARTLRAIAAQGAGRVLPRRRREEHRGVPESERRHHHGSGSRRLRAVRGRAGSRQLPRHRGLRVPAELAGLRDARGAQHPRGLRPQGDGTQQRAVPARGHRSAEAVVRRPQRLRRRSEVRPEHPDGGAAVEGVRGGAPLADRSEPRHRRRAGAGRSARR